MCQYDFISCHLFLHMRECVVCTCMCMSCTEDKEGRQVCSVTLHLILLR